MNSKINIISGVLVLSFLYNYKLYNENINLKKEKYHIYNLYKNTINEKIYYINKIKKNEK